MAASLEEIKLQGIVLSDISAKLAADQDAQMKLLKQQQVRLWDIKESNAELKDYFNQLVPSMVSRLLNDARTGSATLPDASKAPD